MTTSAKLNELNFAEDPAAAYGAAGVGLSGC